MVPIISIPTDAISFERSQSGVVWLDASGIIISVITIEKEHTIQDAKNRMEAFDKVYDGVSRPLIVDFTLVKSMNREAREYYSSQESKKKIKSLAIVTGSTIGRLVGNFFMRVGNHELPSKIFSNVDDAKKWALLFT